MADEKITDLPVATVVNASDVLPIVQSGTTKQAAASLIGGGSFLSANTARVDPSGNDGTGEVGDLTKPFLTIQGAIDAIEAGSFPNPVVELPQPGFTENVTTSLVNIYFLSQNSPAHIHDFGTLTLTALGATVYLDCAEVSNGIFASGGLQLYLLGNAAVGGDIQAAGPIDIFGNATSTFEFATVASTTNDAVSINDCSNSQNGLSLAVDSGTSIVTVKNTPIWFVSSAAELHLYDSIVSSTNHATLTFIDGPKWVELSPDLIWLSSSGAPTTNGAKVAGKGSLCSDYTNGKLYINGGTKDTPDWKLITSA